MTSLENRPHTALLVVDVQNGVVGNAFERDRVVANIAALVAKARAEHVPVLWVQHSDDEGLTPGSEEWTYVTELERYESEPLVPKTYPDAFEATDLEEHLAALGIGRLVVAGAQTAEDMRGWGFPVSPEQSIAYTNAYWSWANAPGRKGSVTPTAEVDF